MYDHMSDYEPRELLFEALGRVEAMKTIETDMNKASALADVANYIKQALKTATMYKKTGV